MIHHNVYWECYVQINPSSHRNTASEGIEKLEIPGPRKHRKSTGLNHGKSHATTELWSNIMIFTNKHKLIICIYSDMQSEGINHTVNWRWRLKIHTSCSLIFDWTQQGNRPDNIGRNSVRVRWCDLHLTVGPCLYCQCLDNWSKRTPPVPLSDSNLKNLAFHCSAISCS
jgi:hypothetical protein